MTTELFSWGAAGEVTGSKHFLKTGAATIMVDCGAFQGRRDESDRKNRELPFDPKSADAVILTHAHYDHCGLSPLLAARGFDKNIFSTPATRDLANLILLDSAHIQSKDLAFLAKRAKLKGGTVVEQPLYDDNNVRRCMQQFVPVSYHKPFNPVPGIETVFYDAGHILGSAMAVVDIDKNTRIGFSGDLGRKNLPIIRDPEVLPPVDYLVMESTYGNRTHKSMETTKDLLAEAINAVQKRGGKILIPAFAIERTQELVFLIHQLSDRGLIRKIPIYVDSPMAVNATTIFKQHEECFDDETLTAFIRHHENPFGFNEMHYITSKEESQKLNTIREPCIIISSSGMCESGRILHHLIHSITDPRNMILFVGFMAEHTLGRKILEKADRVRIFDDYYPVNADVRVLNSFSGHADYNEIMEYVRMLDKTRLKKIFLVHGEKDAQQNLEKLLSGSGYATQIVKAGERYIL